MSETFSVCMVIDYDSTMFDEFNEWYEVEHLPDRVAVPGVQSVRRYSTTDGAVSTSVAVYHFDSEAVSTGGRYAEVNESQREGTEAMLARCLGARRYVAEGAVLGQTGNQPLAIACAEMAPGADWTVGRDGEWKMNAPDGRTLLLSPAAGLPAPDDHHLERVVVADLFSTHNGGTAS